MLKLLIQAGAKIDARRADGISVLFFCRPELISTLLELGADIDLKNNDGLTAFVNARLTGDKARIAAFKKNGRFGLPARIFEIAQDSKSVFELAATGTSDDLAVILDKDPTQRDAKNIELGETPLHAAAASGNIANIRLLIENGAAVDATNDFLRTPLHYAAIAGHYETVKLLCEAKAGIHALDARGTTPLHDAAAAGHRRIYDYLINLGASDSTLDNQGRSAASLLENPGD
jgi:ankyrin repeat protein